VFDQLFDVASFQRLALTGVRVAPGLIRSSSDSDVTAAVQMQGFSDTGRLILPARRPQVFAAGDA
jgi:hypothetical protein